MNEIVFLGVIRKEDASSNVTYSFVANQYFLDHQQVVIDLEKLGVTASDKIVSSFFSAFFQTTSAEAAQYSQSNHTLPELSEAVDLDDGAKCFIRFCQLSDIEDVAGFTKNLQCYYELCLAKFADRLLMTQDLPNVDDVLKDITASLQSSESCIPAA